MTYRSHITDGIFQHLLNELDRPDCKTASRIVAKERVIYALRHDREANPLNIRIAERKTCTRTSLLLITSVLLISAFAAFVSGIYHRTASHAKEASSQSMTMLPNGEHDFYSAED